MARVTFRDLYVTPTVAHQIGDTADVDDGLAEYLVSRGTARLAVDATPEPPVLDEEEPDDSLPARSAPKKDWVAYATSEDGGAMDADAAKKMTRDELAALYHDGA